MSPVTTLTLTILPMNKPMLRVEISRFPDPFRSVPLIFKPDYQRVLLRQPVDSISVNGRHSPLTF